MQVYGCNFDKFSTNSWFDELDNSCVSVADVCHEIIKTIGGHKKIKKLTAYCALPHISLGDRIEFEESNITLLKRSESLCFCKWNEYIVSDTNINDIENIIFNAVHKENNEKNFVMYIKENNGFYWKYEIIV